MPRLVDYPYVIARVTRVPLPATRADATRPDCRALLRRCGPRGGLEPTDVPLPISATGPKQAAATQTGSAVRDQIYLPDLVEARPARRPIDLAHVGARWSLQSLND